MKKQVILVTLAASIALGAGCQSPVTSGFSSRVAVSGDRIIDASLKTDNPGVARHVALASAQTQLTSDGFLKVIAQLASTDHRDYAVQYKFRWFDETGMEVTFGGERPWQQATIHGGETFPAVAVSPIRAPSAFVVQLRAIH